MKTTCIKPNSFTGNDNIPTTRLLNSTWEKYHTNLTIQNTKQYIKEIGS